MNILLICLLGIVAYNYIFPLFDGFLALILTKIEKVKGKDSLEITKINVEIQKLQVDNQIQDQFAVGFQAPDEEYYYEDDEFWEEDKLKNKIGF